MATNEVLSRLMDERGVSVRDLARAKGAWELAGWLVGLA